jgi:hypothetical protein
MYQEIPTDSIVASTDLDRMSESTAQMERLMAGSTEVIGYADFDSVSDGVDGVYLSPFLKDEYGTDLKLTDVQLLPDTTRLGAGKSHHEVMFSELTLAHNGDEPRVIDVALKRFTTGSGQAYREFQATEEVRARGFDTFDTLAIVVAGDTSVLVTKKRDDIYVLDNIDWQLRPEDPEYGEEVAPVLHQIAESLAEFHQAGVYHGDAVAKNFAVNERNKVVFFDFEDTSFLTSTFEPIEAIMGSTDVSESLALKDLVHFWQFQTKPYENPKPFLINESPEVVVDEFVYRFLNPYIEKVVTANPDLPVDDILKFRREAIAQVARSVGAEIDETILL